MVYYRPILPKEWNAANAANAAHDGVLNGFGGHDQA
jgi:hypothetical protein